jgi:hypothetical protein
LPNSFQRRPTLDSPPGRDRRTGEDLGKAGRGLLRVIKDLLTTDGHVLHMGDDLLAVCIRKYGCFYIITFNK